jgi:hypothetical protein
MNSINPANNMFRFPAICLIFSLLLFAGISGCGPKEDPATCTDGILNGDETAVDCGGPDCSACPSCYDGFLNQGEDGIDCGGPCSLVCYTDPACTPTNNEFNGTGAPTIVISNITTSTTALNHFEISASASNAEVSIQFGLENSPHADGNFAIETTISELDDNEVHLEIQLFDGNTNPFYTATAGTAHLKQLTGNVSITFCDIVFETSSTGVDPQLTWSGNVIY